MSLGRGIEWMIEWGTAQVTAQGSRWHLVGSQRWAGGDSEEDGRGDSGGGVGSPPLAS